MTTVTEFWPWIQVVSGASYILLFKSTYGLMFCYTVWEAEFTEKVKEWNA